MEQRLYSPATILFANDQVNFEQYRSTSRTGHARSRLEVRKPGTMARIHLIDICKTFDRVDHHILLATGASLGLPSYV